MEETTRPEGASVLGNVVFWVLAGVAALIPIFFIPSISVPFLYTKTLLFLVGLLIVTVLFIALRLREGTITIPRSRLLAIVWLLPIAYLVSAFTSANFDTSLFGHFFEVDTVGFIAGGALLATLVPLVFRNQYQIFWSLTLIIFASGVLALFQLARLFFGPEFLSLGVFNDSTSNLIGKWNDLAIFFGLIAIVALVAIQEFAPERRVKIVLGIALGVAIFFLATVNFLPVWITVGSLALVLFIHGVWKELFLRRGTVRTFTRLPVLSLVVVSIALVFIFGGQGFTNYLSTTFGISQIEARPSWQSTLEIARGVLGQNPLGSGPNTFSEQWSQLKPEGVNQTLFWNADFTSGIGFIPTSFVTTGAVGAIAWLLFLGWLLWSGFRHIVVLPPSDKLSYFYVVGTFLGSVYLWAMAFIYTPGTALLILAFFFTGLFAASVREAHLISDRSVVFSQNPKLGFASVFGLTLLLILSVVLIYSVGQRYAGAYFFQRSVVEANIHGNLDASAETLTRALSFAEHDSYWRLAADLELARLSQIVNDETRPVEERREAFQATLASAINAATTARDANPGNYQNWVTLGRIYQNVVPLQVEGAYEEAKMAYERAVALAPRNPALYLLLAELEAVRGNEAAARDFIAQSVGQKANYAPAYYLLGQLELNSGNLPGAITAMVQAASIDSQNPVTFYQLGVLLMNAEDEANARAAFERAVALNPSYSNARYFLGILYARAGQQADAIAQFERIQELNPDNPEVQTILENLRAGGETAGETADAQEEE